MLKNVEHTGPSQQIIPTQQELLAEIERLKGIIKAQRQMIETMFAPIMADKCP